MGHYETFHNPKHDKERAELYLSDQQVAHRYGTHRTTVWRWVSVSDFPAPVKLSPRCSRWPLSDLLAWEQKRSKERG